MPRDWSRESWHKVFPREDGAWPALSWQARGLYRLLQSEVGRDGVLQVGRRGSQWVAVVFRMTEAEAGELCGELRAEGFVVVQDDDSWFLPHHAEQQATTSGSAERVRRHRERQRVTGQVVTQTAERREAPEAEQPVTLHALHVTEQAVTRKRKERKERSDHKDKKATRARAREAAASPADPKAQRIASELASHRKFESLDHAIVAEELLGALGSLALGLSDERIPEAIALAAAEAESGANERRLRQVLGWKLKDAANGRTKVPRVQGDDATFEAGMAKIYADIAAFEAQPKPKSEIDL